MKYIMFVLAVWCAVNLSDVFTYATAQVKITGGTCADEAGMCVNGSTLNLTVDGIDVTTFKGKNFVLNSANNINCNNADVNFTSKQINCTIMI